MKKYFFGSYFKLQSKTKTLALIPSYSKVGAYYIASLQIITDNNAYILDFPYSSYKRGKGFECILDNNTFNESGIKLDINKDNVKLNGEIEFKSLNKLKGNIMGPFKFIPFLECIHSVHSIYHSIKGKLYLNGELYDFNDSLCYIEGDRGRSFPKVYSWCQSFLDNGSLMLSVADIPFGLFHFTGIIGFIKNKDINLRIGTYKFARALKIKEDEIIIKQGKYKFILKLLKKNAYSLAAPKNGKMDRIIKESIESKMNFKLYKKDVLLLDETKDYASFEYEYKKEYEK